MRDTDRRPGDPNGHIHEMQARVCRICGWDGTRISPLDTLRPEPLRTA